MIGYTGRPREAVYTTADRNLPSHDPGIDNAILATCSTTSPEAVKEAKIFAEQKVNMSMITATTPEILEEKRKNEKFKESAWDQIKQQGDWEKRVVYLTQDETKEKKLFTPLNTPYEHKLGLFLIGFVNTMGIYHNKYSTHPSGYEKSDNIPLKAFSDTLESWLFYCQNRLIPSIHKSQKPICDSIQAILNAYEIRHVSPYVNSIEGNCLEIRLANLGYSKKGKSVKAITSENFGHEGSTDLKSDTVLIVNALTGTEVFAHTIIEEGVKKRVENIIYMGDPDSDIAKHATIVIPIPESVHRYSGIISLGYPAMGVVYDAMTSQLMHDLNMTEEKLWENHSEHG
jgi:hypothetical protein